MPKVRPLSRFPEQMHIIAAAVGTEPIRLTQPTEAAAKKLRFQLYDFRTSIRAAGASHRFANFDRAVITLDGNSVVISSPEKANVALNDLLAQLEGQFPNGLPVPTTAFIPPPTESFVPSSLPPTWTPPPPKVDPYEAYLKTPEPQAPVDPFDLTETRSKIDSFTTAVTAWLGGDEPKK